MVGSSENESVGSIAEHGETIVVFDPITDPTHVSLDIVSKAGPVCTGLPK